MHCIHHKSTMNTFIIFFFHVFFLWGAQFICDRSGECHRIVSNSWKSYRFFILISQRSDSPQFVVWYGVCSECVADSIMSYTCAHINYSFTNDKQQRWARSRRIRLWAECEIGNYMDICQYYCNVLLCTYATSNLLCVNVNEEMKTSYTNRMIVCAVRYLYMLWVWAIATRASA